MAGANDRLQAARFRSAGESAARDTAADWLRPVRVDPHLHTVASHDGVMEPAVLLSEAERAGLDAVVVTDHDTVRGATVAAALAGDFELVVIVGCEVTTADGHLLAIGVDDAPEPGRPLGETARAVRSAGGVAVVPHPFQRSWHGASADAITTAGDGDGASATSGDEDGFGSGREDDGGCIDGVEVYNALTVTNLRNAQARRFAGRHGYAALGGSDAHTVRNVGIAATAVGLAPDEPVTERAILEAMQSGRTAAVGRTTSSWQYVSRLAATVRRKTPSLR